MKWLESLRIVTVSVCLMVIAGCSAPQPVWNVDPQVRSVTGPSFEYRLAPLKSRGESGSVIAFTLTVANLSRQELSLDWNRSVYLHNDQSQGQLVFAGADPSAVRESRLPLERIAPGSRLEKEIAPLRYLAKAPIRDRSVAPGQSRISGGPLPPGKCTVRLVMVHDGRDLVQDLTLRISRKAAD